MVDYRAPGAADERPDRLERSAPVRVVEGQLRFWYVEVGCCIDYRNRKWVLSAVPVDEIVIIGACELVPAGGNVRGEGRGLVENEGPCVGLDLGMAGEHVAGDSPELLLGAVEELAALGQAHSQPVVDFGVEVFQELLAGVVHRLCDLVSRSSWS